MNSVVLDKTGTVTLGHLQLVRQCLWTPMKKSNCSPKACCVPRGRVTLCRGRLCKPPRKRGCRPPDSAHRTEEVHGKGVLAECGGDTYWLGRREWLIDQGCQVPEEPQHAGSMVWLGSVDNDREQPRPVTLGYLLLADVPAQ